MTATDIAPATAGATPAAPAATTATPAAEPKSVATESVLSAAARAAADAPAPAAPDYGTVTYEGASDKFLGDFRTAAQKHGVAPDKAQALLNDVLKPVFERSKEAQAAAAEAEKKAQAEELKAWQDELAKDPEFAADKHEANAKAAQLAFQHAPKGVFERLKKDGLEAHPAVTQLVVHIGRRLMQATSSDKVAAHGASAPTMEDIADTSIAAIARSYYPKKGG